MRILLAHRLLTPCEFPSAAPRAIFTGTAALFGPPTLRRHDGPMVSLYTDGRRAVPHNVRPGFAGPREEVVPFARCHLGSG